MRMHVTPTDFRDLGRGVMDPDKEVIWLLEGGASSDLKAYQEGSR